MYVGHPPKLYEYLWPDNFPEKYGYRSETPDPPISVISTNILPIQINWSYKEEYVDHTYPHSRRESVVAIVTSMFMLE